MFIKDYTREDYLAVQNELLFYFGKEHYSTEEELQEEFANFKSSAFYPVAMKKLELEGKDINPKHWHLCKGCGKPFLAKDRRGVEITCYREIYNRFSLKTSRYFNKNYECRMKYKREIANERNRSLIREGKKSNGKKEM